jgi:ABC-type transport system involved in multi-copper enzyme maturation permease subunit
MMQLLRTTLFFWRTYLLRTLLTKRMALVTLGCAVPPTMAWLFMTLPHFHPPPVVMFLFPSLLLVLQLMVPLASVIAGSAVISEELDDRTITYLLTRPIPRAAILLGRWLATLTILLALVGASVTTLGWVVEHGAKSYVVTLPDASVDADADVQAARDDAQPARDDEQRRDAEKDAPRRDRSHREEARVHHRPPPDPKLLAAMQGGKLPSGMLRTVLIAACLGVAVYSALFAVLGTFLKHPMIVGLGYAFAIEGFLANLPGQSQALTIQYYLRSYLLSANAELWRHSELVQSTKFDSATTALTTLAILLVVTLVAGCITISRKQYVLSA